MRKILVVAPIFRPAEIEWIKMRPEIRGHVGSGDNTILADFLDSAVEAYQEFNGGILCRSTWDLYLDAFPEGSGEIETPAPLADVESITYLDSAGAEQTVDEAVYSVDAASRVLGRVALNNGQSWPTAIQQANAVTVRILAGYANPAAIPKRKKDGLVAYIQGLLTGADLRAVYEELWSDDRRIHV